MRAAGRVGQMTKPRNTLASSDEILDYWFGDVAEDRPFDRQSVQMQRWYGKSPDIDEEIRRRFEPLYESLRKRAANGAVGTDGSLLDLVATIIVLDQFPRNMYRDTPRMYESDEIALRLAREALADAGFRDLDLFRQLFTLLPFMHAEDIGAQQVVLDNFERFRGRARERNLPSVGFFDQAMEFAHRHRDIIRRFGRFPHRNAILGRSSTPEEVAFLDQPDSGF